jgi:hypothetical protein
LEQNCSSVDTVASHARSDASGVPDAAPRLSPRLLLAIERFDDGRLPIAEIGRRVGAEAERLGLTRPSYSRVRTLVQAQRRRPRGPTAAGIAVDLAFRTRSPQAVVGDLPELGARHP